MLRKDLEIIPSDISILLEKLDTEEKGITSVNLSVDTALRECLTKSLKNTNLNRIEIATLMSESLGLKITKAQIDAFTCLTKKGYRFPAAFLPSFVHATQDRTALKFLCERAGGTFIEGPDIVLLELARIEEKKRGLIEKESLLRTLLKKNRGSESEEDV